MLLKHKEQHATEKEFFVSGYEDFDLVICAENGVPYNARNLLRTFHIFHDLRHTHAALMMFKMTDEINC